jgi:SET domain-containing protein
VNHSTNPNVVIATDGENLVFVATAQIEPEQEITTDYRQTLEVRKCLVS